MKEKDLKEFMGSALDPEAGALNAYISEYKARKVLGRSTTWFWELRKGGFPYTKLGGETFYRVQDFIDLLEAGFLKKS